MKHLVCCVLLLVVTRGGHTDPTSRVIVRLKEDTSLASMEAVAKEHGVADISLLKIINGFSCTVNAEAESWLQAHEAVLEVEKDDTVHLSDGDADSGSFKPDAKPTEEEKAFATYLSHFEVRRKEQTRAAEEIFQKEKFERRYQLTKTLVDEMMRTLRAAQRNLTSVELNEYPRFPYKNDTVFEPLLKVWENTAFFGDLLLRLPDIVHQMVDDHAVRMEVIEWSISMCLDSPLYIGPHQQQLKLMQQECGLVEADSNYVNPFRKAHMKREIERKIAEKAKSEALKVHTRRENRPRLSREGL